MDSSPDDSAELVAFLLTDVEGSSLRWLNHRAAMQQAMRRHDELLRNAIATHNGEVFKTGGDAFYAAFARPSDALGAAVAAQQQLARADWSGVGGLKVRMAVHVGTAQCREGDYFGPAMNRAARLLSLGHGGQILMTSAALELVDAERESRYPIRHLGAHPLDDPAQPVDVHQVEVPSLDQDFPPLRTTETRPTNLPRQTTRLIGRETELAQLRTLLREHALVTVTGSGGVGKTRLALEAAGEALHALDDGVWLVELAGTSDEALVPGAVATALRIQVAADRDPTDTLVGRLHHQQRLLLLDNCEHVIVAVARLVERVLADAPRVRVLASSQEPLGIAGEQVFRLRSLDVPSGERVDATHAMEAGAVQLFVERARAVDPNFAIDDRNAEAIAAICRRLDGIALAIEMAAARAPLLGVAELSRKLNERFRVLTGGRRTALPRQQTLRATLDWSHGLLGDRERKVLRRLAILTGGFTLASAIAVASDETVDEYDVIDDLARLVARSLVVSDSDDNGPRYRLLETTRAYALEKLAEAGETQALQRRHAVLVRTLFERAYDEYLQLSDRDWRQRYLPERDNLRGALDWAFGEEGDPAVGVALLGASTPIWRHLGLYGEARERFEAASAHVDEATPAAVAGRFWLGRATQWVMADYIHVRPLLEHAVLAFRRANQPARLGESLVRLAEVQREVESMHPLLDEAQTLIERANSARLFGRYHMAAAWPHIVTGDRKRATAHARAAVECYRAAGAEREYLASLSNLADDQWASGDLDAAIEAMREVTARIRQSPEAGASDLGVAMANLAGALIERGDLADGQAIARETVALLREDGTLYRFLDHIALGAAFDGRIEDAARLAGFCDAQHQAHGIDREANEERAHVRLALLLDEKLAPDALERLMNEGAVLTEEDAAAIALR